MFSYRNLSNWKNCHKHIIMKKNIRRANLQTTGTIYNKKTQLITYADDIDIVGRSQSAVREAYLLERETAKVGAKRVNWRHFEVVKEFVYLGSLMTPTNYLSLEIQQRIQTANRCFFGLRKHLQSSQLFTPDQIHHSQDLDPLSPALRQWVFAKREENQLLVFERKVLRTICGPKIENGVYRRRYNHELEREFDSPNVLKVMKTSRLRYAGHMIGKPEDLLQKALFRAKPNGRINQGRLKSRWAVGVNSDGLALGVRDLTHCAQDRQTLRDLLQQALTKYWL
jgi:hypothetical protein